MGGKLGCVCPSLSALYRQFVGTREAPRHVSERNISIGQSSSTSKFLSDTHDISMCDGGEERAWDQV